MAKINILTVDDIAVSRFCWWSAWIDVAVFNYGTSGYLLQMKVSRSNSKRFRTREMCQLFGVSATISQAGDLVQMSGDDND